MLELSLEAFRREASNDAGADAAEHEVGIRITARWCCLVSAPKFVPPEAPTRTSACATA